MVLQFIRFLGVITSGRKDDGFDDSLDCVIDKRKSDRNSPVYFKKNIVI
jgi:hypothetical protein